MFDFTARQNSRHTILLSLTNKKLAFKSEYKFE